MTEQPSPREQAARQLRDLTRKSREARERIRCEKLIGDIQKWQTTLQQAPERLGTFRSRGYIHDGWLEKAVDTLGRKLPGLLDEIHDASRVAMGAYSWHLDALARDLPDALGLLGEDPAANRGVIAPLEDHVATVKRVADDLFHRFQARLKPLTPYYRKISTNLHRIDKTLTHFDTPGFDLLAGEHPLRTVDAELQEASGAKGRLFLTDMRLRFVGIEKKVIKKGFLGIGRETEDVPTVLLDEPIGRVRESTDTKKGFIIKDQILTLNWHDSSMYPTTTFDIKGTAKTWDTLMEAVMSGQIDRHRVRAETVPPEPVLADAAPVKCAACGARFSTPLVRGMTERVCDYCGQRHPL